MGKDDQSKKLVVSFLRSVCGKGKTGDDPRRYVQDPILIKNILELGSLLPSFDFLIDEVIAEHDKVVVRGRIGVYQQERSKKKKNRSQNLEIPFVYGFRIAKDKIIDYWTFTDTDRISEKHIIII